MHTRQLKDEEGKTFFQVSKGGFIFKWYGGPYIDVFPAEVDVALDCINVWNHETDTPTIDDSMLEEVVEEWLNESLPDWRDTRSLHHHIVHYSR